MRVNWKKIVLRKIPIAGWLPKYDRSTALADLVAGITVGLTLIPQSIAYAALADLSPQYGLYSSVCGGLVYMFLGTVPEISIAPTALLSLLTYNYTHGLPAAFAVLLCFFAGCVQLLCGAMNLGFLVEFVSIPVVAGFTSAASLIIASAQVKNLLGLKFNAEGFVEVWTHTVTQISQTKKWDAILSFCCCVVLLLLRQLKNYATPMIKSSDKEEQGSLYKTIIWFICVSRNAIVVVLCAVAAFVFELYGMKPFSLTEKVEAGLPPVKLPSFEVTHNNHTYNAHEMTMTLGSGILVVPMVAIIGNVAIAKAFSKGKVVDASQEMIALGICNLIGSVFSSMPVNGSFSRSAVNNASGVRTPFGGLYTGILVILALSFLTPYFSYIPKATLSSVLICAVIFMIELSIIKPIWRTNKMNLIPFTATFIACLIIGVELGILLGILVDLIFMLYFNARPYMDVEHITTQEGVEYTKLTPEGAMLFPAVEHMRKAMSQAGRKTNTLVIDCIYVTRVDFTAVQGLAAAVSDLQKSGVHIIFVNLKPEISAMLAQLCDAKCTILSTENEVMHVSTDKIDLETNVGKKKWVHLNEIISSNSKDKDDTRL